MDPRPRYNYWIAPFIIAGLLSLVESQPTDNANANVPVREISAKAGSTATIVCGSNGIPAIACLWERPAGNGKLSVTINKDTLLNGGTSEPGYGYVGAGLESGSCGLLIKNVTDGDSAIWNCKVITDRGYILQGDVRVEILKKPSTPEFSPNVAEISNLHDPEEKPIKISVTCGSYGGQPEPTLRWFVGDEEITQGLDPYERNLYNNQHYIYQTLTGYKFTAKDNGKALRCVVVHDALGENDIKEIARPITVYYAPQAESDLGPKFVPNMGQDYTLTLNISGNPKPTIFWRVGDLLIHPGQSVDKYRAYSLVELSKSQYAAGLLIKNVEEEDLQKIYTLEAQNSHGKPSFDLRVSSNDPGAGSGLSAGGIIGLVLGVPALLILIAVIVVYTRARGLLCFKGDDGTASEKERMDDESGTGVGPEEKAPTVTQSLSSRLSAIYENFVAKRKEKGAAAPAEEEAVKVEKDALPEDPPSEKKPEDIVYAELDLVNETNGKPIVRGTDDKTEYAEIVGVVPMGTKLEEPKDKTPTASLNGSPKKQ